MLPFAVGARFGTVTENSCVAVPPLESLAFMLKVASPTATIVKDTVLPDTFGVAKLVPDTDAS